MSPARKAKTKTTARKSAAKAKPAKKATRKVAAKKTARKTTSKKAAPKKAVRKKAPTKKVAGKAAGKVAKKKTAKKVVKKAAPKKAPAKKAAAKPARKAGDAKSAAPARSRAPAASQPTVRRKSGRRRSKSGGPPATKPVPQQTIGGPAKPGLGTKWECFECGAKFYDLNRPEPICPKCGADQRKRPKTRAVAPVEEKPAPAAAPMEPGYDEEAAEESDGEALQVEPELDEAFLEGDAGGNEVDED